MNRSDDYGRRRRPAQRYGGFEEGYGDMPGDDRDWRRRDPYADPYADHADRYGNGAARSPYNTERHSYGNARNASPRRGAVYYPGRPVDDERYDESSPHSRGYVSAYSNGYEDGYQAASRSTGSPREVAPVRDERWRDTRMGQRTGYEDYGVEAGRNFRQRPSVYGSNATARGTAGYPRPTGPKNYARSDERVREEVCERLAHAPGIDVSEVSVNVSGSVVTLTGHVDNRRTKYAVEDIADDTYGVSDVVNQIHVRPYGVLASE